MPTQAEKDRWIRRNEAARKLDHAADEQRSMTELLEETATLSRTVSELRANAERPHDVRSPDPAPQRGSDA